MGKSIKIFKSFEEQEFFFLKYFYDQSPSERLQALARLQKKNYPLLPNPVRKITLKKHFVYGH